MDKSLKAGLMEFPTLEVVPVTLLFPLEYSYAVWKSSSICEIIHASCKRPAFFLTNEEHQQDIPQIPRIVIMQRCEYNAVKTFHNVTETSPAQRSSLDAKQTFV